MLDWLCKVEYLQASLSCVLNGIGRAACLLREVADTGAAMVYHVAVALVHTAPVVTLREADHFVGIAVDPLIPRFVRRAPAIRLVAAWNDNDQPDIRLVFLLLYHGLRREGVKT